jgi:hypothetical protein
MLIELLALVKDQKSELKDVASGLAEGKREKVAAGVITLLAGLVTGHPEVGALAPFAQEAVRLACAASATRRLQKVVAAAEAEDSRARAYGDTSPPAGGDSALIAQIAEAVEALVGQALIQLVRVEHATKDELVEALGGVREDLADFRADFQRELVDREVRVDVQHVREGATGLRISDGARARLSVGEMTVTGPGSVGIDLVKR